AARAALRAGAGAASPLPAAAHDPAGLPPPAASGPAAACGRGAGAAGAEAAPAGRAPALGAAQGPAAGPADTRALPPLEQPRGDAIDRAVCPTRRPYDRRVVDGGRGLGRAERADRRRPADRTLLVQHALELCCQGRVAVAAAEHEVGV